MNRPMPACPKCGSTAVSYTQARLYDGQTSKCHTCGETFDQAHAYAAATPTPERVTLQYRAPIWVTVNLTTGDVERVYMDDEGVTFDDQGEHVEQIDGPDLTRRPDGPAIITKAQLIADEADWTSTENRCVVWRGAEGGPVENDRFLLVEESRVTGRIWLSSWTSKEDAATYHDQEGDDWKVRVLIDVTNGSHHTPVTGTRWEEA